MLYDYGRKVQVIDNQLKLRKRKSSVSDVDVIEIPHVTAIAYSRNGQHLMCGLANGTILKLDPNILTELGSYNVTQEHIMSIKFSPDSLFMTVYVNLLICLAQNAVSYANRF
jgi:WD40 repeat protein